MNLPNQMTVARIALIPLVMVILLWTQGTAYQTIAAALFFLTAVTDWVDGYIARKYHLISNMGKFLDPLADKLLVSAVLIVLVQLQRVEAWIAVVIISREFAVTGLRLVAAGEGIVIAAAQMGKLKTLLQMVALTFLILGDVPFAMGGFPVGNLLLWLAMLVSVISGVDYFYKNRHVFSHV